MFSSLSLSPYHLLRSCQLKASSVAPPQAPEQAAGSSAADTVGSLIAERQLALDVFLQRAVFPFNR